MIALEACLILETITAIPLSGYSSAWLRTQLLSSRGARARGGGSLLFFHAYKLDYCTNKLPYTVYH